ncbi:MAG: hypothetical protein LC623_05085, partial [Halobacteriales archaeon]|nr:hypothetical protein [Halobacteriales archaeon]
DYTDGKGKYLAGLPFDTLGLKNDMINCPVRRSIDYTNTIQDFTAGGASQTFDIIKNEAVVTAGSGTTYMAICWRIAYLDFSNPLAPTSEMAQTHDWKLILDLNDAGGSAGWLSALQLHYGGQQPGDSGIGATTALRGFYSDDAGYSNGVSDGQNGPGPCTNGPSYLTKLKEPSPLIGGLGPSCPPETVGVPPTCVPIDCPPGSIPYTGDHGSWCATPAEIVQDQIPNDPVPGVFPDDDDPSDPVEPNLVPLPHPDLMPQPDLEATDSCQLSTCTVVFVHGYARDGPSTANYSSWTPIVNYYLAHGYEHAEKVSYYGGDCASTSAAESHPNNKHRIWFASHHASGNGCDGSPLKHDLDTDLRHLAYHLAWWFYDTYGTKKVDVVAHSMGGLLVRYAIAMVEHKDPNFPPALNIEDIVTMGTPHSGAKLGCLRSDLQGQQMCPSDDTMKWLTAEAQDAQGVAGTDWTLMGADDDDAVSTSSATGMIANHKVQYPNDFGGTANTAYEHSDYYQDNSTAADGDADWQEANGDWHSWNQALHSIRWAFNASVAVNW